MPTMRDAIKRFTGMPSQYGTERKPGTRPLVLDSDFPDALAEYIVAEVGPTIDEPTVDEVLATLGEYSATQPLPVQLRCLHEGEGAVYSAGGRRLVSWPSSDNPGKTILEAIQAHTKSAPTAAERFDRLTKALDKRTMMAKLSTEELEDIMAVREALKGDG